MLVATWRSRKPSRSRRRAALAALPALVLAGLVGAPAVSSPAQAATPTARTVLAKVRVHAYAPVTGYTSARFGRAWADINHDTCDTKNDILWRDLGRTAVLAPRSRCIVARGSFRSYYTGRVIRYSRAHPANVSVDRVVTTQQAWRSGARGWTAQKRLIFANDPLNLVTVDKVSSLRRGNRDTTTWKPATTALRCRYVARRVAVQAKYGLWITPAEKKAYVAVLSRCPRQPAPTGVNPSPRPTATPAPGTLPDGTPVDVPAPGRNGTGDWRDTMTTAYFTPETTSELRKALAGAKPGSTILLGDGVYLSAMVLSSDGTPGHPITIRAVHPGGARLSSSGLGGGTGLLITGDYWRVEDITVVHSQRGILLDGSKGTVIVRADVHDIGNEGVHFRRNTVDSVLRDSHVYDTGMSNAGFGEGVYIGSAVKNWQRVMGDELTPDRSDRNSVVDNVIENTAAEGVDIKEGSTGGTVAGNTFVRAGFSGANCADSWIDVKGQDYTVSGNRGDSQGIRSAIQVHEIRYPATTRRPYDGTHVPGSGEGTVLRDNVVTDGGAPVYADPRCGSDS